MIVYVIENKVNGMKYVGQTINSLAHRWTQHLSKTSSCRFLKHAIAKYGSDNFALKVVDTAKDLEELNVLEEKHIAEMNTLAPFGYNLNSGGKNRIASQETRDKMSKTHTGLPHPGQRGFNPWIGRTPGPISKEHAKALLDAAHKFNKKRIRCLQNGKVYEAVIDAAKELGLSQGNVSLILQGKRKQTRGYSFEFVNPEDAFRSLKKVS